MRRLGTLFALILLAAPALAWLAGVRPGLVENRALAPWPVFSLDAAASGAWFRALDDALVQRLPLRQSAVDAKRTLLVGALGERRFENVILGDDGMLFLRPTLQSWCGWSAPWNVARRANAALAARFERGPDMLWVSVPDKFAVEGALLPPTFHAWRDCAERRRARYRDAMAETLGDRFLDLLPPLQDARAGGGPLYHREDTHWTSEAALVLPRAIVERFAPGTWDAGAVREERSLEAVSDLALQLGLEHRHEVPRMVAERPGIHALGRAQVEAGDRLGVRVVRHRADGGQPLVPGTTLIVHDSFLPPVTGALAPYFEELVLVQWEDLDRRRFDRLVAQADRVVFQSVERLVTRRQANKVVRW